MKRCGKARLVYFEHCEEFGAAINYDELIKKAQREARFALIEAHAPEWLDLWDQWLASSIDQKSQASCQARGDGGF